MDKLTSLYIKAFNHGYFLAEHKPILIEIMLKTSNDNEFIQGLKGGQRTFELERKKERINEINIIRTNKKYNRDLEH